MESGKRAREVGMDAEWGKVGLMTLFVKERARELWEKDGRKQGHDLDYWLRAEEMVKSQMRVFNLGGRPEKGTRRW